MAGARKPNWGKMRRFPRFPVEQETKAQVFLDPSTLTNGVEAKVLEISRGGCSIQIPKNLHVKEKAMVVIKFEALKHLQAETTWVKPMDKDKSVQVGLRFVGETE